MVSGGATLPPTRRKEGNDESDGQSSQAVPGPTATEYAVMLALIIIVALAAITLLGAKVNTIFTNVEGALPTGA